MTAIDRPPARDAYQAKNNSILMPSFFYGLTTASGISALLGIAYPELSWQLLAVATFSVAFGSADFIDVLRRRRSLFSPRSLISLLMINSVYITPVLHLILSAFPRNVALPTDMNEAMTNLAILQLLGHAVYFFAVRLAVRKKDAVAQDRRPSRPPRYHGRKLSQYMVLLGFISLSLYLYTVLHAGGPQAWFNMQVADTEQSLSGAVLDVAEAFPTLFFIAYVLHLKNSDLTGKQLKSRLFSAFLVLVTITFITSGLRGSRANVVWPSLAGLVTIHLLFYRIQARIIIAVALIGASFAGIYDIYKKAGVEGIEEFQSGSLDDGNDYSSYGFGLEALLLGDFSRAGVQSIVLDRWNAGSFSPFYGSTYIGGAIQFVPGSDRLESFPDKRVAGTEILHGVGSSETSRTLSSRIYGLQGEALINFGIGGAVLIFVPYAFLVKWAEKFYSRAERGASLSSAIFVPLMLPVVVLLYLSDFDNAISNMTSLLLLPFFAMTLATCTKSRIRPAKPPNLNEAQGSRR